MSRLSRRCTLFKTLIAVAAFALAVAISACARQTPTGEPSVTSSTGFRLSAPMGLDLASATFFVPEDNPLSEQKVALGKRLFFDKSLSVDGSVSCASCHVPERGFADGSQFSAGVRGKRGPRHTPTLINRAFSRAQFWDGRAATLEDQALAPLVNSIEMGNPNVDAVIRRLKTDQAYREEFRRAFPEDREITDRNLARALSSFERTILAGNSSFDQFANGKKDALSESASRGYRLFLGKAGCAVCHVSFNFSDEIYHNLGIGSAAKKPDEGRFAVSRQDSHQGAFKTPTLRELTSTAPYMSDGSLKTLEEVIDYYDRGCQPNRWLSPKIKALNLNQQEKADLVEFLKSLSGQITWYGKSDDSKRASRMPPKHQRGKGPNG